MLGCVLTFAMYFKATCISQSHVGAHTGREAVALDLHVDIREETFGDWALPALGFQDSMKHTKHWCVCMCVVYTCVHAHAYMYVCTCVCDRTDGLSS